MFAKYASVENQQILTNECNLNRRTKEVFSFDSEINNSYFLAKFQIKQFTINCALSSTLVSPKNRVLFKNI